MHGAHVSSEVAARAHQPTLCLVSALARHELTDVIPPVHDVAIPRGAWQPVVSLPVLWHKFALATFEVGRTTIPLDDVYAIGLYDALCTIIDAFRLRHAVGPISRMRHCGARAPSRRRLPARRTRQP